jgi:uncharacterized protein (TIGR02466 family)
MRLELDPSSNILQAFPTRIGRFEVPNAAEINPILEEIILAREPQNEGASKSNIGGWHSDIDFHMWPEVQRTDIVETMQSAVSHMVALGSQAARFNLNCEFVSWANINRWGSHNSVHNHCNSHWSGVYYVTVPKFDDDDIDRAGDIMFYDPRGAVNMMVHPGRCNDGEAIRVSPIAGHMLLFPSWLYHSVNPFKSDVVRISIAFNARVEKFEELPPQ